MDFDRGLQHARRATTTTSILDVAAWICLLAGCIFWGNFFWMMIAPVTVPDIALATVMAVAYAIVLPMLLSTLVPSTPAGMLLQQTRWQTTGFVATIAAALFLGGHALFVLWAWWGSRPAVAATGQDLWLAIGSVIVFVLVPALAWVQAAPDRWVAEVQSAMAVRRLKAAHEANMMIAKTQYLRGLSLMRRGLANLSAQEQAELAGIHSAFQHAENEAIGGIVDSLEAITGVSSGVRLLDDRELTHAYTGITTSLAGLIAPPNEADYVTVVPASSRRAQFDEEYDAPNEALPHPAPRPVITQQEALQPVASPVAAHTTVTHHDAPRRTVTQEAPPSDYSAFYETARERLTRTWTTKQLAEAVGVSEATGREMIAAWTQLKLVDKTNLRGHYAWKEGEA